MALGPDGHSNVFYDNVDYFMVMSKSVESDLLSFYPDANYVYTPHPLYDLFGDEISKIQARQALDITEKKVLLYFGCFSKSGAELILMVLHFSKISSIFYRISHWKKTIE